MMMMMMGVRKRRTGSVRKSRSTGQRERSYSPDNRRFVSGVCQSTQNGLFRAHDLTCRTLIYTVSVIVLFRPD